MAGMFEPALFEASIAIPHAEGIEDSARNYLVLMHTANAR